MSSLSKFFSDFAGFDYDVPVKTSLLLRYGTEHYTQGFVSTTTDINVLPKNSKTYKTYSHTNQ